MKASGVEKLTKRVEGRIFEGKLVGEAKVENKLKQMEMYFKLSFRGSVE